MTANPAPAKVRIPLTISAAHPALPGHFPGQPVVPGVVLLDTALAQAEAWLQRPLRVAGLPNAKFIAALLPEQAAELELTYRGTELRFSWHRDTAVIAQGVFRIAEAQP